MRAPAFPLLALLSLSVLGCPPPVTVGAIGFFRGRPLDVSPGESVQLTWESTNAGGCLLNPGALELAAAGAVLVTPEVSTEYQLTCNGASSRVRINVRPDVSISRFGALPAQTIPDGVVELSWESADADGCTLEPGLGEVALTGTRTVLPTQTTTYTLTCKGEGPDAVATTQVTVVPATSLDMPTNLLATAQDGMLLVTWSQTAGSAVVYFAEAPGIEVANIDTKPGRAVFRRVYSPFTISGLVNGRTYYLRVAAMSGSLESALSAEVSGTWSTPTPKTSGSPTPGRPG